VDAAAKLDTTSLQRPLVFLFTADEEEGCMGAERLVPALPWLLPDLPLPRLAWIGEPTSYKIFHAQKGIVIFTVTVRGQGGHSSMPERGVNAIAVAGRAIDAIGRVQAELHASGSPQLAAEFPGSAYTTLNFGRITGGSASNVIAASCEIEVSYRALPDGDPLDAYRLIRRRLAEIEAHDYASGEGLATVEVGEPLVVPPLLSPRGTTLEAGLASIFGGGSAGGAPFATDGGQFVRAGIHSLICGPGELEQAHQPNESIRREAFAGGTEKILAVVHRLCGATARA
jgi:acetylornithine deacetylase